MKSYILVSISLLLCSCQAKLPVNVPELSDGNPTTCFVGTEGVNKVIFDEQYTVPLYTRVTLKCQKNTTIDIDQL